MKNLISDGLIKKTNELKQYMHYQWPKNVGQMAVSFVNGNFRAQGWKGSSFERWKANSRKGTILVKSGSLRRRTNFRAAMGSVTLYNDSPYARVHNNGYKVTIQVKEHMRRRFAKVKKGTGKFTKSGKELMKRISVEAGCYKVSSFTRKVNIPRRQFMPLNNTGCVRTKLLKNLKAIAEDKQKRLGLNS